MLSDERLFEIESWAQGWQEYLRLVKNENEHFFPNLPIDVATAMCLELVEHSKRTPVKRKIKVLRLMEYEFESEEQRDRVIGNGSVPLNGIRHFGTVTVRSASIEHPTWVEEKDES